MLHISQIITQKNHQVGQMSSVFWRFVISMHVWYNCSNIIRPEESCLRSPIPCAPWCTGKIGTAADTGYCPTVEGSSLKPWRAEKVVTVCHTLSLMNTRTWMLPFAYLAEYLENESIITGLAGRRRETFYNLCSCMFSCFIAAWNMQIKTNLR